MREDMKNTHGFCTFVSKHNIPIFLGFHARFIGKALKSLRNSNKKIEIINVYLRELEKNPDGFNQSNQWRYE